MSERDERNAEIEWHEGGDGHGYVYQYIGPIHYLCECGDYFLNRERWLAHKAGDTRVTRVSPPTEPTTTPGPREQVRATENEES